MDRRLLLVLLVWCCIQQANCGRSFIDDGKPIVRSLENNAIDSANPAQPPGTGGRRLDPGNRNLNLIERLNLISQPFNSIESSQFARSRRSAKELIKRNLGERYPSDEHSNKTLEEALTFLRENDRQ